MILKTTQRLVKAAGLSGLLLAAGFSPSYQVAAAQGGDLLYLGLPDSTRQVARETVQRTLETVLSGEERQWRSPNGVERGYIMPIRTFKDSDGKYCREYREELHNGAGVHRRMRIACRGDGGEWLLRYDSPA
jgi:surface antigen